MKNCLTIITIAFAATGWATAARADTVTSTAGQSQSTDTTTTTSSMSATIPLKPGQEPVDHVSLQSYYNSLWTSIRKFWWVPEELFFKQVKVNLSIAADGRLLSAKLAQTSGDSRADNLALIAIKRAAPFEAPPPALNPPFNITYTVGFAPRKDRDIMLFNGKKYGKNEEVTLATGTKIGHSDRPLTELDKQFQLKREATLLKMNKLWDAVVEEEKSGQETNKKAQLMTEYADCLCIIQEQKEARGELNAALAILDKNQAPPQLIYASLSRLAQLNYSVGDLTLAEGQFKRAIAIKENDAAEGPAQKAELKTLLETYAKLLYKQNRTAEADEIYKKIKALGA